MKLPPQVPPVPRRDAQWRAAPRQSVYRVEGRLVSLLRAVYCPADKPRDDHQCHVWNDLR